MKKHFFYFVLAFTTALILSYGCPGNAAQPDSLQVYTFTSNTSTFDQGQDGYYQFDWSRAGIRLYKDHFMGRLEYDYSSNSMKYSYVEYSQSIKDWKVGAQFGKWLMPCMYNWPGPSTRPMTRWSYSMDDLSVYGTGISAYAGRGLFKVHVGNYAYDAYTVNLQYGPVNGWWIEDQGQGAFFKKSFHPWINLFSGWTNYEDAPNRSFPDRRNSCFIQNHVRLGDRTRIYAHYDLGDHRGAFVGGLSYMLIPGDTQTTAGLFYDSENLWQLKVTFGFEQMFRSN